MLGAWLFSGAFLSFVWATALVLTPGNARRTDSPIGIIFLAGLWQLAGAYASLEPTLNTAPNYLTHTADFLTYYIVPAALMLLGPQLYFYFQAALNGQSASWQKVKHILPALVVLIFGVADFVFVVADTAMNLAIGPTHEFGFQTLAFAAPKISILGYLLYLGFYINRANFHTPQTKIRLIVQGKSVVIFLALALGLTGFLSGSTVLIHFSAALLPAIMAGLFIISRVFPELTGEIKQGLLRYSRSRLAGVDVDSVRAKIERLMLEDRIYADEDLSLSRLAGMVGLTPHQLSEFLNQQLGLTYSELVNHYRIEAAKELLLTEPERSTLSVAFGVGFNSKSSFYRAFRKRTGLDPSKFRATS